MNTSGNAAQASLLSYTRTIEDHIPTATNTDAELDSSITLFLDGRNRASFEIIQRTAKYYLVI
jgi:hypothetical protein